MQELITERDWMKFEDRVNQRLGEGWEVVPGTMIVNENGEYGTANYNGFFAIVVQMEKNMQDIVNQMAPAMAALREQIMAAQPGHIGYEDEE